MSEWNRWEAEHKEGMNRGGHDDGTSRFSIRLDMGHGVAGYMIPIVSVGGTSGLDTDSRVARSQLRRSLANLDAVEDLFSEVAGIKVWLDGECPCSWCSGKGNSRGDPCEKCSGKGVR